MASKQSFYFPNLNSIRFFAAAMVIVHHIEQIKAIFGLDSAWETSDTIRSIGKLGVLLFFTLSGFLITFLMLAEEKEFGKIDIKQFYIRRILRIWPLYFIVFFLAFFVLNRLSFFQFPSYYLPAAGAVTTFVLFALFLSNVFLAVHGPLPYASQTWSVATEEQFYLIWPIIMRYSKNKMLSLCIVIAVVAGLHLFLITDYSNALPYKQQVAAFWKMFNIDCMALGGIFALLLFERGRLLNLVLNLYVFIPTLLLLLLMVFFQVKIPFFSTFFYDDVFALLFAIVIINMAAHPLLSTTLEFKWLSYLGKISYGLYMYHGVAIVIAIRLLTMLQIANSFFILIASMAFTIAIAHVSYHYFESMFLRLKSRFTSIQSGSI